MWLMSRINPLQTFPQARLIGTMIEFDERRPWTAAMLLHVIGPGGAGKSSLGTELAPLLNRCLVDLDYEFCRRREDISAFMHREGYARYKMENSALAAELAAEAAGPTILIASSGFLTLDNPPAALQANRRLLNSVLFCLSPTITRPRAKYKHHCGTSAGTPVCA